MNKKQERAARAARIAAERAKVREVVTAGTCPLCGGKVLRNWSLTGWWQCEQLGAVTHRKDPSKPSCSWQGFTE